VSLDPDHRADALHRGDDAAGRAGFGPVDGRHDEA
jgi:hypothetical protein